MSTERSGILRCDHPAALCTVGLVATAAYSQASIGVLDSLTVGSHTVEKPWVVVQNLAPIQAADRKIRGVLGENFLAHFNLLLDY
jgi:hypothetical protein